MGPTSYMRSVVDRNVVMRRTTIHHVPSCTLLAKDMKHLS